MSVVDELPGGARILILRLRSLGDCVLTTPAIQILKQARPDCSIAVAVEPRFADVFRGNPHVQTILPPAAGPVKQLAPHLCINFHGGTRSMALTAFSRARQRAGFAHHRGAWIYNLRIPTAQEILGLDRKVHTAEHLASAIFWLGAPGIEIPRASLYAAPAPAARPYAVIHAMAAHPEKTWPADRFLKVAQYLREQSGIDSVFIAAAGEDLSPFSSYSCVAGAPLRDVMSLIAGASLFLGNDSGPAHIAAAFGLPVLVLFGSSDPAVWAPWKTVSETFTAPDSIANIGTGAVLAGLDRLRVKA
ncbi:MAG: glycosyltransferase family 9 protein [Acidobacteriia bacterium]|nr:glycosyltransferase family 9 protein [Terriglobia bacterium]